MLACGARPGSSWDMVPRTSRIALAGLLGVLLVGCEGESERATSTPDAAPTTTDAATSLTPTNLEQYLLQVDEVPGLEPMATPQTDSGSRSIYPRTGSSGFGAVATSRRPTSPPKATAAPASAASCCSTTEAGARDWMAYETSGEAIRHQIPGGEDRAVPGSRRPRRKRMDGTRPARERHGPGLLDPRAAA